MEKRKILLAATFLFVLIVLISFLAYKIVSVKKIEVLEVWVAKEIIYPRTKISEKHLTLIKVPKVYLNDDVIYKKEDLINKYTQIYATVAKGALFYQDYLEDLENLTAYPDLLLKKDQVSYSLPSDLLKSAGNSLVTGQKVDLYVTLNLKDQPPLTDCLIKAVRITAIKDRAGLDLTNPKSSRIPYLVVLAIDANQVKYLKAIGKIGSIDLLGVNVNYGENEESLLQMESLILPYLQV